jgi:hypothetical protein
MLESDFRPDPRKDLSKDHFRSNLSLDTLE